MRRAEPANGAAAPRTIYLNGKFTAQPTSGVQRAAACWARALDRRLADHTADARPRWVLLCPAEATPAAMAQIEVRTLGPRGLPLHLWEQVWLPVAARDGLLLNLAGSAPLGARRMVAVIHDAAVFDHPQAYTAAFGRWYRFLFRRLARRKPCVLTVSAFSRDRLAARLRLAPERLAIVPEGADHLDGVTADPSVLDRLGLRGRPFLLAVGSDNPTKNHARLLQAHERLGMDAPPLVIVGRRRPAVFVSGGAGPEDCERFVTLEDASDGELKALYEAALGLVFPSLYEGYGLPPLEAMACGCPVAAARAGALPEVLGEAALGFDPLDVDAIAAAMLRLAGDAALRADLRERGLVQARRHRWDAGAERLLAELAAYGAGPR